MANVLTRNILECSSLGIISNGPILVKGIMYYPNAVDGEFTLKWWDEVKPPTLYARKITYTNTLVSADHVVTAASGTPFPSTWAAGNVVKCLKTTGSDATKYGLIKTEGNNTAFTVHLTPFTLDVAAVGDWDCYPTYTAFRGKASEAEDTETSMWFPFGKGMLFPNLALASFSGTDVIIIYVG